MKKFRLRIWSLAGKKVIVKKLYKMVELKEDITFFAHIFLVTKARDIDLKQAPMEFILYKESLQHIVPGSIPHQIVI